MHDPNYITISLFRTPKQSGDNDYVCNYGHGSSGKAILSILGKEIINFGRSVDVHQDMKEARVTIERIASDGGGKAITTTQFEWPVVKGGKLQYEL